MVMTGHRHRSAAYHLARYCQYPLDDPPSCSAKVKNALQLQHLLPSVPAQACHGVTFTFTLLMRNSLRLGPCLDSVESNFIFALSVV
jgi:hypothetical protein